MPQQSSVNRTCLTVPILHHKTASTVLQGIPERAAVLLAVDASASMGCHDLKPSRLNAAKSFCTRIIQGLAPYRPETRVAVIVFADEAMVVVPLTPAKRVREIAREIDRIDSLGSSNLTAALRCAVELAQPLQEKVVVIVLSDGHHTSDADPTPVAEKLRENAVVISIGVAGHPAAVGGGASKSIASRCANGQPRYAWIGALSRDGWRL